MSYWSTAAQAKPRIKPSKTFEGFGQIQAGAPDATMLLGAAAVASKDLFAFASKAGEVRLHRTNGAETVLKQLPDEGAVTLAFTANASHLVGLRAGKAYAWALTTSKR